MRLHTYYLHCKMNAVVQRGASPRDPWFSYEGCFKNFTSTMADTRLTLLIDGTPDNPTFIDNNEYEKVYFTGAQPGRMDHGPQGYPIAWENMTNKIKSDIDAGIIGRDDLIYICEDDYIHVRNWHQCVMDLFQSHPEFLATTYVTLYDHPDKYIESIQPVKHYITDKYRLYISNHRHWRQTPNGCGNFIVAAKLFNRDWEIMKVHYDGERSRLLGEAGRQYLSPIPGVSSHMHRSFPSPIINWREQLDD